MAEHGPIASRGLMGEEPETLQLSDELIVVYRQLLAGQVLSHAPGSRSAHHRQQERLVEALVEFGLVEIANDEGDADLRLRTTNPVARLTEMVAKREQSLRDHQREVDQLRVLTTSLMSEYEADRERRSVAVLEHLIDPVAIVARLQELYASAGRELRIFVTNRQTPEQLESAREPDLALLKRGIRVRLVCLESLMNDRAHLDHLLWYTEQGAEARVVPSLPLRMIIQDERLAVVAADGDDPGQGAVILRGDGILRALGALFERYWDSALPYRRTTPVRPVSQDALTPTQLEILRMLASGAKDAAIAHRLGVSIRTVRRLISELSGPLGVESRFAFGAEAVRRGWLDAEPGNVQRVPRP